MTNFINGNLQYIILGLAGALALAFLIIIILLAKVSGLKKRYRQFFETKEGKPFEREVLDRFESVEGIEKKQNEIHQEIDRIKEQQLGCYCKHKMYKYSAFEDMGGDTSFVLGLLDKNNSGILLNGISSRNATYIYAKDIINGDAGVALSKEERLTLEDCINQ